MSKEPKKQKSKPKKLDELEIYFELAEGTKERKKEWMKERKNEWKKERKKENKLTFSYYFRTCLCVITLFTFRNNKLNYLCFENKKK